MNKVLLGVAVAALFMALGFGTAEAEGTCGPFKLEPGGVHLEFDNIVKTWSNQK